MIDKFITPIYIITITIIYMINIKQYKSEIRLYKEKEESYLLEIKNLKTSFNDLYLKYFNTKDRNIVDKDIVDTVRYAMIRSHPDKGGTSEDFQKYKKIYDKIK